MEEIVKRILGNHVYPEEGLKILKENNTLTPFEKNCVWTYCFPKNIGDYELPGLIMSERGPEHEMGWLRPEDKEILLLLRAYSCKQYSSYMKHLLWAFTRNQDTIKVPGINEGGEELKCGVCGKTLYPWKEWEANGNDPQKETLAFASTKSSQCVCLDCQVQMNALWEVIKKMGVED